MARTGQVVMGTVLTITVLAESTQEARRLADAAVEEARRWDDALTIWRPEGELQHLNERAGRGEVVVGRRLGSGLQAMLTFEQATGGAFQPTMVIGGVAPRTVVVRTRRLSDVLRVAEDKAWLQEGVALDPGGIGKGLALDAMVDALRIQGVTSAFLDFGGSSQTAIGVPPGNAQGWGVLVAGWGSETSHGTVSLRDASLSTSRAGAKDTRAIEDPRTAQPVAQHRLATVWAKKATDADAWSTAMVVLGREGLKDAERGGVRVLLEDEMGVARTPDFSTLPSEGGSRIEASP